MMVIFGLGVVNLAVGILVLAPLAVVNRKDVGHSTAYHMGFQTSLTVGLALLSVAGLMAMTGGGH